MDKIESVLRDGLRQAVADRPPLRPIDLDEVVARSATVTVRPPRRRAPRWLAAVAALAVVAALGTAVWLMRTGSGAVPAVPLDSASGSAATELQLTGSSWRAIQIGGQAVVASSRGVPSLTFTSETAVVAADPCNSSRGSYVLEGSSPTSLTFTGWGPRTDLGCEIAQQQRFTAALAETREVRLVPAHGTTAEDVLELRDQEGTVVLQLVPAIGSGTPEPTLAPTATTSPDSTQGAVQVRIRNDCGFDLASVEVRFPDATVVDYGPLPAGAASAYAEAGTKVYSYAWVKVTTTGGPAGDGRTFIYQPVDYVGEQELAPGSHTYALGLDKEDQLTLTLE